MLGWESGYRRTKGKLRRDKGARAAQSSQYKFTPLVCSAVVAALFQAMEAIWETR